MVLDERIEVFLRNAELLSEDFTPEILSNFATTA